MADIQEVSLTQLPSLKSLKGAIFHGNVSQVDYQILMEDIAFEAICPLLANTFGVAASTVIRLKTTVSVSTAKVLYEATSQLVFLNDSATGTITSYTVSSDKTTLTLVTSAGTFKLSAVTAMNSMSVYPNTTLQSFLTNIRSFLGLRDVAVKTWSAGATSTYDNVWQWTDGSLWWQKNGKLPTAPTGQDGEYLMAPYNLFSDPVILKQILMGIQNDDILGDNTTLFQILKNMLASRIPIQVASDTLGISDPTTNAVLTLNANPLKKKLGMGMWPDWAQFPAQQPEVASAAEVKNGLSTYTNRWLSSDTKTLGIDNSSNGVLLFNMVTESGLPTQFAFRSWTPRMFIRCNPTRWGSSFNSWYELYTTFNTTKSSDGVLSAASPIVRIVNDVKTTKRTDLLEAPFIEAGCGASNPEANGCEVTRVDTGVYRIAGSLGLASEGWQLKPPHPLQDSTPLGIVEGTILEIDEKPVVEVRLYKRVYKLNSDTGEISVEKGDLIDVPDESWIDVRLDMDTSAQEAAMNAPDEGPPQEILDMLNAMAKEQEEANNG